MPRAKREQRHFLVRCSICPIMFEAVRRDARYCTPKCRQAISRALRTIKARHAVNRKNPHATGWECDACGSELPADTQRCAVCGMVGTIRAVKG